MMATIPLTSATSITPANSRFSSSTVAGSPKTFAGSARDHGIARDFFVPLVEDSILLATSCMRLVSQVVCVYQRRWLASDNNPQLVRGARGGDVKQMARLVVGAVAAAIHVDEDHVIELKPFDLTDIGHVDAGAKGKF